MKNNKTSFYQYAVKYSTHIPVIQRDYAQGREGKNEQAILTRFLLDISEAIDKNKPLSLNFIYGIQEKNDVFLPIDGQQRLTTLFLLHWFVALRTRRLDIFLKKIQNFSYQTRSSAIDFFESIQPAPSDKEQQERLNELYNIQSGDDIKNFPWFKLDWLYDQTIVGVINTFNRMFTLYKTKNLDVWWENLTSEEKCKITFLYIAINKTKDNNGNELENETKAALTYIKMNARGKHLSNFENAKALIHSLNKDSEDFILLFDSKYIKSIEAIADKTKSKDIGKISRIIDDMMMQLLINLFNDLQFITENSFAECAVSNDYLNYMDILRDFHENPDNRKEFFRRYFDILNRIFCSEIINSDEFLGYVNSGDRSNRLGFCALLSYFYHNDYNTVGINEWKYLLNNFHYKDIGNTRDIENYFKTLFSLRILSSDIKKANVSGSPLVFLSKKNEYPELNRIYSVLDGDWKEEHIKAQIIGVNKLHYDYFNIIEKNFDRRIRALLYMSGYWNNQGDKAKLDLYITMSTSLGLKYNEDLPMELRKMYYLLATGYSETTKSNFRPNIDSTLFSWNGNEPSEETEEKLQILSVVFDFLNSNNDVSIHTKINKIIGELYKKHDWRCFILARNHDKLFYHLDDDKLQISNTENINIFSYVKQIDLNGSSIKDAIYFRKIKNLGAIGQNYNSKFTITYEYILDISIKLTGDCATDFTFYINEDVLFHVYRYSGLIGSEHQFEALEFDITKNIEKYIFCAEKIKEKFYGLTAKEKTDPIYTKDYSKLKTYCEEICGEDIKVEVFSYYNTIITKFGVNIALNLDNSGISKITEVLHLEIKE